LPFKKSPEDYLQEKNVHQKDKPRNYKPVKKIPLLRDNNNVTRILRLQK